MRIIDRNWLFIFSFVNNFKDANFSMVYWAWFIITTEKNQALIQLVIGRGKSRIDLVEIKAIFPIETNLFQESPFGEI